MYLEDDWEYLISYMAKQLTVAKRIDNTQKAKVIEIFDIETTEKAGEKAKELEEKYPKAIWGLWDFGPPIKIKFIADRLVGW